MKQIFRWAHISFLLIAGLLLSCRATEPKKELGGVLIIGESHAPTEINPLTTDSSISANLLDLIFDTLVRFSSDGKVHPHLAERWEISPDQKTWTFYLRKDVTFHDGTPLRAEDVQFIYEAFKKSKRVGYANFLIYANEIRAVDPYTLQIHLSKPDHALWSGLGVYGIAPKRVLENDPHYFDFNQHPVGSGPYRFMKQDKDEIVLEANDRYFQGRPYLQKIIVKILSSQSACLNHLIAGKINMTFLLNPEDYGALSQIPSLKVYHNWFPMFYMMIFNLEDPLFKSPLIRRALNLSINRKIILQNVLKGKGHLAGGFILPEDLMSERQSSLDIYNPKQAAELLRNAGWIRGDDDFVLKNRGRRFEFRVYAMGGDEVSSAILRMMQEQLLEMGIKMTVMILPLDDFTRQVFRKRDFGSILVPLVFTPFFDNNFLFWHSSQIKSGLNFASYSNPEIDRLLNEARLNLEAEKRRKALEESQRILQADPPGIFLFWRDMPIAIQSRFRGVPEKRMEGLRDLIHVWLPKGEQTSSQLAPD